MSKIIIEVRSINTKIDFYERENVNGLEGLYAFLTYLNILY